MLLQPPKMLKSLGSMAEKRKKTPGATSRTSPNFIFGGSTAVAVGVTLSKDQSTRTGARRMAILRKRIMAGRLTVSGNGAHRNGIVAGKLESAITTGGFLAGNGLSVSY